MMFAGGLVPQGWLRCDGSEVSRVTYAQLFAEIGTTYGSGDNVTTFNLPDLGGRFPLGQGSGVGLTTRNLGSRGGEEDVTLTVAEMPSHTHDIVRDYNGGAFSYAWGLEEQPVPFNGVPATTTTFARGGDQAHNNMPPFLAIDFIIKY